MRIARTAAVFYLLQFLFGPGMIATKKIFVSNNAALTASNLAAHETLFRLGFAGNLMAVGAYIVVTALFYALFRPVSRNASFLAACFSLVGCAVLAFSCLFYYAPLIVLAGSAADAHAQQLALVFLKLYGQGYNISLVFFGFYCTMIGYLIIKSDFLPRWIGVAMLLAGCSWVVFLFPVFARLIYPYSLLGGLGELALTGWLLVKGVNRERWLEAARGT